MKHNYIVLQYEESRTLYLAFIRMPICLRGQSEQERKGPRYQAWDLDLLNCIGYSSKVIRNLYVFMIRLAQRSNVGSGDKASLII